MHHRHMGDRRVSIEQLRHLLRVRHLVVMLIVDLMLDPRVLRDVRHALSIRPVGADEQLVPGSDHACEHRLYPEAAAALHEHRRIFLRGDMGKLEKPFPDLLCDLLVIVVPRTVVEHHLLFYRVRRGERSRCKKFV